MSALWINDDTVRWTIAGRDATSADARDALRSLPLLIMMHGYGSHEGDLIGLAPQLPADFVCASPRAPIVAPAPVQNGFAWFPIPLGPDGLPAQLPHPDDFVSTAPHTAALAMLEWIDRLDTRVDGGLGTIALMGFSQGGVMVTSMLRLRPERFACGVNCSGFVAPGTFEGDARMAAIRPPVFWGRDEEDPIIRHDRIEITEAWLPAHSTLETRLYPGIGHSISAQEVRDISEFLVRTALGEASQ